MEPVISPWVFYWIGFAKPAISFFGVIGGIATAFAILGVLIATAWKDSEWESEKKWADIWRRIAKVTLLFGPLFMLLSLFIPQPPTIYKMLIASQVTHERVVQGEKVVKQIYDDILKRVDKAMEK